MFTELLIIFSLALIGGVLALAEFAVVTARRGRLLSDAERGDRSAKRVLAIIENPGSFLAIIHLALTAVAVIAGMYAGLVAIRDVSGALGDSWYARTGAVLGIAILVTYISVILGEILPRRLALAHPEAIAKLVVPFLSVACGVLKPFVWFLDRSAALLLRPMSLARKIESDVSEEDIKSLVTEGSRAGVIEEGEKQIIHRVFRLGERPVVSLMTPRNQVVFLELDTDPQKTLAIALEARYTWFPVRGSTDDEVVGIVSIHDLVNLAASGGGRVELVALLRQPLQVPDSITALRLLDLFRKEKSRFALVVDEYGGLAGISTVHDVLEVIVGDLGDADDDVPQIVIRDDGTLLVDAGIDIQELFDTLVIPDGSPFEDRDFHSLGGFVMTTLGHVPDEGESFTAFGHRFEVIDMDGNRIDKVLVVKVQGAEAEHANPGSFVGHS